MPSVSALHRSAQLARLSKRRPFGSGILDDDRAVPAPTPPRRSIHIDCHPSGSGRPRRIPSEADRREAAQFLNAHCRDYCLAGESAPPRGLLVDRIAAEAALQDRLERESAVLLIDAERADWTANVGTYGHMA